MTDSAKLDVGAEPGNPRQVDALVIGAGFGGLYMIHRLRGMNLSVLGLEAGADVGGVWYWNRYPGARCDLMSIDYSYSFSHEIEQEWTWTEQFASGKEILAYANFVADKLDLRKHFQFETRVTRATYDEGRHVWLVSTDRGAVIETRFCVMATGPLSIPKPIDFPGHERFKGAIYQAAKWPHQEVSFTGKRVGVIGTGSTGIQIVPVVAAHAQELFVFQRTPSFTMPMRNTPLAPDYLAEVKRNYPGIREAARNSPLGGVRPSTTRPFFSVPPEQRRALMEDAWKRGGLAFLGTFSDLLTNAEANEQVAEFVRGKISEVVVDPHTAELLKPRNYPIFARRPCLDTNYYESFNQPNVHLVDCLRDPIEGLTEKAVRTRSREIELDDLILATGYDGLTGALLAFEVTGRGGCKLQDKWRRGAQSYLGLLMYRFPNLFMVCGPNSPAALANVITLDQQNGDWICDCIEYMRDNHFVTVEATAAAEEEWMELVGSLAAKSLMRKANTWYVGANIDGKPRNFSQFTGGFHRYREFCTRVVEDGWRGLTFERNLERLSA
jgi:cation diffusion facilitator CzcD-associated flavoprotein CzcO